MYINYIFLIKMSENKRKRAIIVALRWEEINNNPERISKLKRFEKDF